MHGPSIMNITLLAHNAEQAQQHLRDCHLCEHHCGNDRTNGVRGKCHALDEVRVFRHRVEWGEEPELVPSHLFYTSGCDLRCKFCIAEENAFNPKLGTLLTPEFLKTSIAWGRTQGAKNLQWVGGEPTIHLPGILEVMKEINDLPDIVWKSDFYSSTAALDLLDGVAKYYVADFKFGNDQCATAVAGVPHYVETVSRNLKHVLERGILIVRHLLLPGHFDCCYQPIVEWIAKHMPEVRFSLRDGYLPKWQAKHHPALHGYITKKDAEMARKLAEAKGLRLV